MRDELRPKEKRRVIDLVREAGIDVSDWSNFEGGKNRAATHPKYCYEWSFLDPGRLVLLNIWHDSIDERDGVVTARLNLRERADHLRGKGKLVARCKKFDRAIQEAVKNHLTVRVATLVGKHRDDDDPNSPPSSISGRLLDPTGWSVTEYDWKTGGCILTRGTQTERFVDQFSANVVPEEGLRQHTATAQVYDRNPALRRRALDRAGGACELCGGQGFRLPDGRIYLETHHVVPLSEGGKDSATNIVAICPNHHREAHHGERAGEIRRSLLSFLARLAQAR